MSSCQVIESGNDRIKKRLTLKKSIGMFLVLLFSLPVSSSAYETIVVKNGGSIEGTVSFAGATVPRDETLSVTADVDYCGKDIPAEKYVIDAKKRIKNVVVFLEEVRSGKSIPGDTVTVTNFKCAFVPHVAVAFKGNKFVMKNDDPMFHTFDVHASSTGREVYHISLQEKGLAVAKPLTKAGLLELSCYVHPWQRSYIYVFDHPYAAVTNEQGEFAIRDIPPGTYTVGAWHEALGTLRLENVKVGSGETTKIGLKYSK